MLAVYGCIVHQHDLKLVAMAAAICVLGCWVTTSLFVRARNDGSARRYGWLFLAGVAAGGSIWCTHFVAMIGYQAGVSISYDPILTGSSFFIAIFGTMAAFAVASLKQWRFSLQVGGGLIGFAVAMMHYTGMAGYQVAGTLVWDMRLVVTSILLSTIFGALALLATEQKLRGQPQLFATGFLTLSIVSLHFIGMSAVNVVPFPEAARAVEVQGTYALGISAIGVGLLIVGMGIASYLIDNSVQTEANAKLLRMALFDDLTGLPNRTNFTKNFEKAIVNCDNSGAQLAYVAIDLDGFKGINDGFGHDIGDAALVAVSKNVSECLQGDGFFARVGGDEFVLIKTFCNSFELDNLLDRIADRFEKKFEIGGFSIDLDASIGVAVYPTDVSDVDKVRIAADLAMQEAKANLSIRVHRFEPSLEAHAVRRRRLAAALKAAVENEDIEVFYQVQTDIRTEEAIGYEALVRWTHPEFGPVSPVEFIPIAEETGLINKLGEAVMRRACIDATHWPDHLKVSVNVSPLQFLNECFAQVVEDVLSKTKLPRHRLQIEITESSLMDDVDNAVLTLNQLRQGGLTIAMDDFGTGYSSLANLRIFPFDVLKIDRGFILGLEESTEAKAIVRAVIRLCSDINVSVLAEGVETEAQRDFLLNAGCFVVQGYLYGQPMQFAALEWEGQLRLASGG